MSLAACGESTDSYLVGKGRWGEYDVSVESRPAPPRRGNNEVVVIITGERHQPVYDALVAVRAQSEAAWTQAIEDGHVGVYRRAVNFGHGDRAVIQVQLKRGAQESELDFPVSLAQQP
jgi:hypothetical protein